MQTFVQKRHAIQQRLPTQSTMPIQAYPKKSRDGSFVLQLQRTIGNQALQRLLQVDTERDCTPCSGILPSVCGAYAANRHWLPDPYVFNATCACTRTPNGPKANCIRKILQDRLAGTPAALKARAARMKRLYNRGALSLLDYNGFVVRHLTPRIYRDHVIAYRTACCPSGPAPFPAWIGVTTIRMPNCTSVWLAILFGGGSCSGRWGRW